MTIQSQLVMIAWIPIVFYLFIRFKTQEAVIISFIVAWLFLPQKAGFSFPGLPDYERMSATVYGILLATIIYDVQRITKFNYHWLDIPMTIWCISPFFSSVTNGLGAYDGLSSSLFQTVSYGGPYFLGRIYLGNLTGMRKLAIGILLGGLAYVPFCLYEIRFSPQLHNKIYGYHAHSFAQTVRFGGFRPTVFMEHGLAVGMWMMAASLIGLWLWKTRVVDYIFGIHIKWWVGILVTTFILSRSTGAYGLLVIGIAILFSAWQFRTSLSLLVLIAAMVFYLQQNVSTSSNLSENIINTLDSVVPAERIQSLEYRFENEELLKEKAQERIVFGWGGWNRNRVYDYDRQGNLVDITTVDSLWIIAFGRNGLVGLISLFSSILIPANLFALQYFPGRTWSNIKVAPAAVVVVVVTLYMLDCLINDMPNPIFILAIGGISGLLVEASLPNRIARST
ncbi:MAG: O-antigen ligase domain-containing protein [Cyanobacteria bacterium P01_G01_bin.67]